MDPMTPAPATKPVHCEHEYVCSPYRVIFGKTIGKDDESCVRKNCKHDTRRSRPVATSQPAHKFDSTIYLIGETEIDRGVVELKNLLAMGNLCQDQKDCIESLRCILRDASNRPVKQPPAPSADVPKFNSTDLILLAHDEWKRREERKHNHPEGSWCQGFINGFLTDKKWARNLLDKMYSDVEHKQHPNRTGA